MDHLNSVERRDGGGREAGGGGSEVRVARSLRVSSSKPFNYYEICNYEILNYLTIVIKFSFQPCSCSFMHSNHQNKKKSHRNDYEGMVE